MQAESLEAKKEWVTDIWDLLFSHMLRLRGTYMHVDTLLMFCVTQQMRSLYPIEHMLYQHPSHPVEQDSLKVVLLIMALVLE